MISTIRQSSLSTFENCPEMFRRRYIEDEIIPPGIAAHIGTGLHKGAEVNHRAKMVTGRDEPLDVIQDAARDGYIQAVKEKQIYVAPEDRPAARLEAEAAIDQTVGLAALYHREVAPTILPALVEHRVEIEVPGLALPVSGTLDVVDADNLLADLKTASKAWPESKANTSPQATIYYLLVKETTGRPPSGIRFDVLIKGKTPRRQTLTTTRTRADFQTLVLRMNIMLQMIYAGLFPPAPTGHWICSPRFCGYWWSCRHVAAHKKILPKRSA